MGGEKLTLVCLGGFVEEEGVVGSTAATGRGFET